MIYVIHAHWHVASYEDLPIYRQDEDKTHILQGCFTGTGAIYDCLSASEVNLKNIYEIMWYITTRGLSA